MIEGRVFYFHTFSNIRDSDTNANYQTHLFYVNDKLSIEVPIARNRPADSYHLFSTDFVCLMVAELRCSISDSELISNNLQNYTLKGQFFYVHYF